MILGKNFSTVETMAGLKGRVRQPSLLNTIVRCDDEQG